MVSGRGGEGEGWGLRIYRLKVSPYTYAYFPELKQDKSRDIKETKFQIN